MRKSTLRSALATLLLGAAALAMAAEAPQPIAGIVAPNVVVATPLLVTAGQPDRASLMKLKAEGYAAVISLAPGNTADAVADEAEILKSQGIEFVHVPIPWQAPEASHLEATAAALKRFRGQKVLVHCQMNMRASAVTFLYRTIYAKEDPATAWVAVKKVWTPKDQWAKYVDDQLRANGIVFKAE
ncbi:MAG: protein tyrosine phosphatase family protein [Steroidobacteraceae bacterium]